MNLIKKFFSYFKRRKKVDNVSPPNSDGETFQDMLNNVYMSQITENVKESIQSEQNMVYLKSLRLMRMVSSFITLQTGE